MVTIGMLRTVFGSDCPIIFVHGHESNPKDTVGWRTWKSDEYESAMEIIIAQQYGGYTAGSPLNCSKNSTPASTGGETHGPNCTPGYRDIQGSQE